MTPHSLRHAFAVHLLDDPGPTLRTIQLLMGHSSLNTTARYCGSLPSKVCATTSPLDPAAVPDSHPLQADRAIARLSGRTKSGRSGPEVADVFRRYGDALS